MKFTEVFYMIKRISFLLLCAVLLLTLAGCKKGYEPIPSSETESTPVVKLGNYDVPYELFRTFFLTNKSALDGGNSSMWIGDTAKEYRQAAIDSILPQICEIYAMFAMCESYGIDISSEEINEQVQKYVDISIDGGTLGGSIVLGFDSHDDYLTHLRSLYMNDSVSRLLIKYSVCEELLRERFFSEYKYEKADVEDFYYSDECAHITWLNILYENTNQLAHSEMRALADNALAKVKNAKNLQDVINTFVQYSAGASESVIENGFYIGKYTLDRAYMADVIDAAFSLKAGEYSDVIENDRGFYIIYVMKKDSTYLNIKANYEEIEGLYLNNQFYRALDEYKTRLLQSASYTEFFNTLNFAEIEF